MLRTGVFRLSQLSNSELRDIFGKEKNISLLLYDNLYNNTDDKMKEKCAELILNRFNSNRNVLKRTYRDRFNKFDELAADLIIRQQFSHIKIHDLAISDGRASSYFINKFMKMTPNIEYHGSDIAISYNIFKKSSFPQYSVLTDDDNKIIEISIPPFVWNYARKEGEFYFLNNILKNIILKIVKRELNKDSYTKSGKINLIDNSFMESLEKTKNYKLFNHNLLLNCNESYNVIRAMNILHQGYFDDQQIQKILLNIHRSLSAHGIFIEGSNEDAGSVVSGGIYHKNKLGFSLITCADKPSRIIRLIENFKA